MSRVGRNTLVLSFLGLLGLAWPIVGCQTAPKQPAAKTQPATQPSPADAMARTDAERAENAIDQDQREMSGERRPRDPGRERVVDQPRVGGGRR